MSILMNDKCHFSTINLLFTRELTLVDINSTFRFAFTVSVKTVTAATALRRTAEIFDLACTIHTLHFSLVMEEKDS